MSEKHEFVLEWTNHSDIEKRFNTVDWVVPVGFAHDKLISSGNFDLQQFLGKKTKVTIEVIEENLTTKAKS